MSEDPNSLQNLHDLVPPGPVSLWPIAPGWYGLGFLILVLLVWVGHRKWRDWKSHAYRRAALRELDLASSGAEVAEILRRTALAFSSRAEIAMRTGDGWADWLDSLLPTPMPEEVRQELSFRLYQSQTNSSVPSSLRQYADDWVRHHSVHPDQTP